MLKRIAVIAGLSAAIFATGSSYARIASALTAKCEHPDGSYCSIKQDTGRINCQCHDGEHELRDEDAAGAGQDDLMDACWDAWAETCGPPSPTWVSCEEPDVGDCRVSPDDGGVAKCSCGGEKVEEEGISELVDLDDEALEDACYEQLDRLCEPEPEPVMGPPPPVDGFGGSEPAASCSVDSSGRTPWMLLVLVGFGWARRRRA